MFKIALAIVFIAAIGKLTLFIFYIYVFLIVKNVLFSIYFRRCTWKQA